nr:hypothetical protein [uncultured Aquabacterium sp.]
MRELPENYLFDEPSITLELLDELEAQGFTDEAFAVMHHFENPQRIASHRSYCSMVRDEEGKFRTNTNRLVQQRLRLVLRIINKSGISSRSPAAFMALAHLSIAEFPHAAKQQGLPHEIKQ